MALFLFVFRSGRFGFEVKPFPRARVEYSSVIVICGANAVNGERVDDRLPACLGRQAAYLLRHVSCSPGWKPGCRVRQDADLLHDAFAQKLVLSGEQVLHKIVTAFVRIA